MYSLSTDTHIHTHRYTNTLSDWGEAKHEAFSRIVGNRVDKSRSRAQHDAHFTFASTLRERNAVFAAVGAAVGCSTYTPLGTVGSLGQYRRESHAELLSREPRCSARCTSPAYWAILSSIYMYIARHHRIVVFHRCSSVPLLRPVARSFHFMISALLLRELS